MLLNATVNFVIFSGILCSLSCKASPKAAPKTSCLIIVLVRIASSRVARENSHLLNVLNLSCHHCKRTLPSSLLVNTNLFPHSRPSVASCPLSRQSLIVCWKVVGVLALFIRTLPRTLLKDGSHCGAPCFVASISKS